jgi:hypothetical protein
MDFTIDDAFITYRYSDNLASGFGFSWNYEQTQEFGFTSYFHTLIVGLGIKLGFDAVLFAKSVTIIAGIITIVVSGLIVRVLTERKMKLYFLPSIFLGFIPGFGLHAVAGLETTLFIMLFALSIFSYSSFINSSNSKKIIPLILFIILATFTRYEGILLVLGIIIHQLYLKIILKNKIEFKKIILFCVPVVFLIGLLSFNNYQYGQILPNTFYVKQNFELADIVRNIYAIANTIIFVIPHILLICLNLKNNLKNKASSFMIIQIIVVLIPFLFINQWQNYVFRFYFHIIPIIIALSAFSLYQMYPKIIFGKYSKIVIILVVILLAAYVLPSNYGVNYKACSGIDINEQSHSKIGKILNKYDHLKENTIGIAIDAGAVPYYSHWKAYDYTLNDVQHIQNGWNPDRFYSENMVMIIFSGGTDGEIQEHLPILEKSIIETMQQPNSGYGDEITLDDRFKNFKLITTYPRQYIFVEENFALENEDLMNELIENSAPLERVC